MKTAFQANQIRPYLRLFFGVVICQCFISCEEKPPSPESVLRDWLAYKSEGECEKALKLEVEALPTTQEIIAPPCEPYASELVSLFCNVREETAYCPCIESRDKSGDQHYYYDLKKIDGKWKIVPNH